MSEDLEELEEQVTCWVCFEVFNEPVTLACSHTFCETCAGNIFKKNPSCPFCRKPFGLPLPPVSKTMKELVKKYQTLKSASNNTNNNNNNEMQVEQTSPFLWLPKDMVVELVSFLPVEQIGRCSQICKQMKTFCDDPWIWRQICERDFPFCSVEKYGRNWKHAYLGRRGLKKGWEGGKAGDFEVVTLRGHTNYISTFRLYRGTVVSGSADNTLRVWKADSTKPKHTLVGHTGLVTALEFNETSIISGSNDGNVLSWDPRIGASVRSIKQGGTVSSLQFDDNKICSGSTNGSLNLYDIRSSQPIMGFKHSHGFKQIMFDSRHIVGLADDTIKVYDLRTSSHLHDLDDPAVPSATMFRPVDMHRIATANDRGQVNMMNVDSAVPENFNSMPHSKKILDLSVDGTNVYTACEDGNVGVFSIGGKSFTKTLTGHKGAVNAVMGVNGSKLVSGGADNSLKVFDVRNGKSLYSLLGGSLQARANNPLHPTKQGVSHLEFDETRIVASMASLVKIYDFEVYKGADKDSD